MTTIGFIGLGTMGAHMAANIQRAGHRLVVHDMRRAAAERLLAGGAEWAESPKDVAARSDVVFLSLPGPPEVEQVVFNSNSGILAGAHPGMALFDLSTDSPAMVRKFHAALAEKGCQAFDAPVSGGPEGARTGKLAIWCGGDRATYDRLKPILDSFGDQAAYIGPIGTATVAKLVHNMAGYAIGLATAEVFSMGVKAGMDPVDLWAAVRQGALGRRRTFDRVVDQFLVNRYDPPAFQLKLAHKDVSLAVGLGRELGVPMHICEYTLAEMTRALERPGWATKDSRIPMTLQLERAGVTIAGDPARIKAILDAEKGG
ncbi:MAG: NAD(P)-dependent oxidoreductase [Acetobacteraceae bacterium]|nr:NAD(P)-dependent oxidoreductase [Acetobacteraceae bacterium]